MRARFQQLKFVDDEVLAQAGKRCHLRGSLKVMQRALEIRLIGQHRECGRARQFQFACELSDREVCPYEAFGWRCFLHLGDDGGAGLDRIPKPATEPSWLVITAHCLQHRRLPIWFPASGASAAAMISSSLLGMGILSIPALERQFAISSRLLGLRLLTRH